MSLVITNQSLLAIAKQKIRSQRRALHSSVCLLSKNAAKIDFSKSIEDFKKNGIAILPVRIQDDFVQESRKLCMSAWVDALARGKIIKGHEVKLGMEHGFKEIVLRAPGRYDMQWKIDGEKHFLDEEMILSKFMPFVHEVLGGPQMTNMNFNGCLMSLPGAKEQLWHVDGEHLFTSEDNFKCVGKENIDFFKKTDSVPDSILPAHCLNIFIPLVDVESNNGGTEFCLGSHFHTKFFNDSIVWQDSTWKDRIGFKGDVLAIKVNAGEVLAFDYRVLHRALEHGGKEVRPLLYYTFTKRWFSDAMNFADLPSLTLADGKISEKKEWRENFPSIMKSEKQIFCDGAAGSQVPEVVIKRMTEHLRENGCSNIGGDYSTSQRVLNVISKARAAGRDLLGAKTTGEITFGLNCSNLMFHLARSMENNLFSPGDNIILSRACHDANIAPWLHLARTNRMEVRWLEMTKCDDPSNMDKIDVEKLPDLIDSKTKVISLALASNVTGRIHLDVVQRIHEVSEKLETKPFLVLDATHFVPHRRCSLVQLQADAIICSAYKFFGPHIGVMAHNQNSFERLQPAKVGLRFGKDGLVEKDVLDPGAVPSLENCEISRWENGTNNYEGLAGFDACVDYFASLGSGEDRKDAIDEAYNDIQKHEETISQRFLERLKPLLEQNMLTLFGSHNPRERTPTFAFCLTSVAKNRLGTHDPYFLVKKLNEKNIFCTHGNHYAVELVDNSLQQVEGLTRISFLHYNTVEEVDRVVDEIKSILEM